MAPKSNAYARTVYSTETGRVCPQCGRPVAACTCKKKAAQPTGDGVIRILLEKKGRGGKTVSVITGLSGSEDDLRALAADLKRRCGTGGTIKDGVIEIQGDHRDTLVEALKARGVNAKRAGG
jgi:translation initiation factor 1